jgi:hypothetical protein
MGFCGNRIKKGISLILDWLSIKKPPALADGFY